MRLRPSLPLAVCGLALLPAVALAQDGTVFVSQYYECIVGQEGEADRIAEEVLAPILDRHMEMGHISTWGWLAHDTGGPWRRVTFFASPDMATLFATRDAIVQDVLGEHAEDGATLNTVCPSHDDYIWGSALGDVVPASDANSTERAPAAISQYIRCDFNREAEADAILQRSLAPIYDRWVESGAIQSWNVGLSEPDAGVGRDERRGPGRRAGRVVPVQRDLPDPRGLPLEYGSVPVTGD